MATRPQRISGAGLLKREQIQQYIAFSTQEMVARSLQTAIQGSMESLERALRMYLVQAQSSSRDLRAGLVADAREVGESVVARAKEIVDETRVRNVDPRTQDRLHGALQRALDQMMRPTNDGVILSIDTLDQEARHWRRLNYGVGEQGGGAGEIPNITSGPRSEEMPMPRGWFTPGGGFRPAHLYGTSTDKSWAYVREQQTRGIKAKHFLENSIGEAEKVFPAVAQRRVQEWVAQLRRSVKAGAPPVKGRATLGQIPGGLL